ncbi:hypothetical protein [Vibrio harveyi]|uniref:hypothetical protein n=1 Tax=Vibrio harveyi TaxID=669 RepID=UPI003CE82C03
MKPKREILETVENLPINLISSAISRCPVFYGKDAKAVSFINTVRNELIGYIRDNDIQSNHWADSWREYTKQLGIKRLETLGRDIADRQERNMVRNSIERYLSDSTPSTALSI